MIGGILIIILTGFIAFTLINKLKEVYPIINAPFLKNLFIYHVVLSFAYYGYILFNPSDSKAYYQKIITNFRGPDWLSFYGTSTTFIEWIGYPFIQYLGFSFEASMALFSFFGFVGFVYFYIFFKENLRFKHHFLGYDLITIIFFLPNLHFWSASFGKGAVIFLGLGLFFFGIVNIQKRYLAVLVGAVIIYHVRPHIMLVILVSSAAGFIFSTKGVGFAWRLLFLAGAITAFFFIYKDVLTLVGIEEEEFVTQGLDLSQRSRELSKATSGVDITQYNLPMQIFTFLYRPLFVDAPGLLGIIVSFENVFYLLFSLQLLSNIRGWRYLLTSSFLVKSAFLSFITISAALAQISGNLGLAMRQKSQVMILLLFAVISFLDERKLERWKKAKLHQLRAGLMKPAPEGNKRTGETLI